MSGGPAGADRHSLVWIEPAQESEVDDIVVLLDLRVGGDRSAHACVDRGLRGSDAIRKHDVRVHAVDRHRPAVAGDVPVQLVERANLAVGEEEADRVGDVVADYYLPVRVIRAGNIDVKPPRPAVVLGLFFYTEPLAGNVSDVADSDVEPRRTPLRRVVVQRDVAVDSVPLAGEADRELLGDVERSVGVNGEQRIEVLDADGARLRAGVLCKRGGKRAGQDERRDFCDWHLTDLDHPIWLPPPHQRAKPIKKDAVEQSPVRWNVDLCAT